MARRKMGRTSIAKLVDWTLIKTESNEIHAMRERCRAVCFPSSCVNEIRQPNPLSNCWNSLIKFGPMFRANGIIGKTSSGHAEYCQRCNKFGDKISALDALTTPRN